MAPMVANALELPIDALQNAFQSALGQGHVMVSASTGSGKSTRLPVWARERGPVLVVEPRRVACTSLAEYVAGLLGAELGQDVGYAIRFDQRYNHDSDIVFVTPGVALRWLRDGGYQRYATVILDEFHERRWDTDLLLALLLSRGQPNLVVTSATLAADRLAEYLGAPHLEGGGQGFPVKVSHQADTPRMMPTRKELTRRLQPIVQQALSQSSGDVLVFLPGRGEIQDAQSALSFPDVDVLPLYAGIAASEQRRALNPGQKRRVILATNVAETSLTIPGVTAVVDSGLERRTGQRNGRTVLQLTAISQAGAEQRRGRAGRTAPGLCFRLWGSQAPLEAFTPPEIQREELTDLVLAAANAGYPVETLDFLDALPTAALEQAHHRLRRMGAVDTGGEITEHGQFLFNLPLDPLFSHLITAMPDAESQGAMVDLCAALSVRPVVFQPSSDETTQDTLRKWQPTACDATTLIAILRAQPPELLRINKAARQEARHMAGRLRAQLGLPQTPPETLGFCRETWLRAVAQAAPALVFVRREKRRHAMGNGAREVTVGEGSRLEAKAEATLVFDEHSVPGKQGTRQTFTRGTCLAPIPLSLLEELDLGRLHAAEVDWQADRPIIIQAREYAGRVIARRELEPEGQPLRAALAEQLLQGQWLAPVSEQLQADLHQWGLYVALGFDQGEVPEAKTWVEQRLEQLGVQTADDAALIEPSDLQFQGVPQWQRQRFDSQYPRTFSLGDLQLSVHYDPQRKRITLEYLSGQRRAEPRRWELPAWPGWQVQYQRGSRLVTVR